MRVGSVEEAIELAYRLRDTGEYDWFRGQPHPWPPHSSLVRLLRQGGEEAYSAYVSRLDAICRWLGNTPALETLLGPGKEDQLFAMLQHYGVPTHYIDFTTDPGVAGFFASDVAGEVPGPDGCIYLLNTDELRSVAEMVGGLDERRGTRLELVTVEVDNLWRLQKQHGVFVFADYTWEVDFPLDRILFRRTGYPAAPSKDEIYPEHRSELEAHLDRLFLLEARRAGQQTLTAMLADLKSRGTNVHFFTTKSPPNGFHGAAFVEGAGLPRVPSWQAASLADWRATVVESADKTLGNAAHLVLDPDEDATGVRATVSFGVRQLLRSKAELRMCALDWSVRAAPARLDSAALIAGLRSIWNGMRRLPYSSDEIAAACGTFAALLMAGTLQSGATQPIDAVVEEILGPALRVEFSYADSASSIGYASRARIEAAVRGDIGSRLVAEHAHRVSDVKLLLMLCSNPSYLLEFESFRTLFATEIIPTQVADNRSLVLYNPAMVTSFGLP